MAIPAEARVASRGVLGGGSLIISILQACLQIRGLMVFLKQSTPALCCADLPAHFELDPSENGFHCRKGVCDMNAQTFCQ